ncbi:AGC protein kinase [Puccinia sorghi]|uniref:AGC protein kinase n=1 Tax=Puccinia sorghi TaxID=27349 RepID=A0A0L6UEA8_9BASI|nr:AGC protein kinase [Puccinia sorghi]
MCALKAIRITGGTTEGGEGVVGKMVATELSSLRRLDRNFPFFAHLKGHARCGPGWYLIPLEYVAGGNLYQHVLTHGPLGEPQTRLYAAELACALDHLHSRGIIFRDLKSENILLANDGHLKITDFGLSTIPSRRLASSICGTPHTIAPEIVRREEYDYRVDWYSLGACLFECLDGQAPFARLSKDLPALLHSVMHVKPRLPQQLTSGCRAVMVGLLAKEPSQRISSLDQLLAKPWFINFDKDRIINKHFKPLFIPPSNSPLPNRFPPASSSFPSDDDDDDDSDSALPDPSPASSPVYPLSHLHPATP